MAIVYIGTPSFAVPSLKRLAGDGHPIPAAILAGDNITGVTIMLMDPGMDSGPILSQTAHPIDPEDTTGTLSDRLAQAGADLLGETLPRWLRGEITPQPQDASQATTTSLLHKDDGRIDWTHPAHAISRQLPPSPPPKRRRTHRLAAPCRCHLAPGPRLHPVARRFHYPGPRATAHLARLARRRAHSRRPRHRGHPHGRT